MLVFWIGNLVFLQAAPLVCVLFGVSFLSESPPNLGFAYVAIVSAFTVWSVYCVFYVYGRRNVAIGMLRDAMPDGQRQIVITYAVSLLLAGACGVMMSGSPFVFGQSSEAYQTLSLSLAGQGFQLRLAELVAVGGLLLYASQRSSLGRWAGLAALVYFCLWRAGFGNRENAFKFLVMLWLYKMLVHRSAIDRKTFATAIAAVAMAVTLLPLFGVLRSNLSLTPANYAFIAVRDLGYSEVAASLIEARPSEWAAPGMVRGIADGMKGVLPRTLFPGKGDAPAKTITGLVTPVTTYYQDGQNFAYAPSYIGQAVYWSPDWYFLIAPLLATTVSIATALFLRRVSPSRVGSRPIIAAIVSVLTYELFFVPIKLDLFNLLPMAMIPVLSVIIIPSLLKIRRRRPLGGRLSS